MSPRKDGNPKGWDPTPEQIREGAAEIRAEWDPRTEYDRRVTKNPRWTVPSVNSPEGFTLTDCQSGKKKRARDAVNGAAV
jgi:hypothetical protein